MDEMVKLQEKGRDRNTKKYPAIRSKKIKIKTLLNTCWICVSGNTCRRVFLSFSSTMFLCCGRVVVLSFLTLSFHIIVQVHPTMFSFLYEKSFTYCLYIFSSCFEVMQWTTTRVYSLRLYLKQRTIYIYVYIYIYIYIYTYIYILLNHFK